MNIKILKNNKTPIWLMRQAGRYLPEYQKIRKNFTNFLDLCYDSKTACEVTIQPVDRFNFDAAIIFSDILVILDALGWDVMFRPNHSPTLRNFKTVNDLHFLEENAKNTENYQNDKLNKVYEAISLVKNRLAKDKTLIGFVGSPWTVVTYMLEDNNKENRTKKQDFSASKKFIYENRELAKQLIDFISTQTIIHIIGQIKAGAEMIQLFDSWAGVLQEEEYLEFVIKPTKKIIEEVKKFSKETPIIGFPRGSGFMYEDYINNTGIDIIGVDQFVPLKTMKTWQSKLVVQGNLDPIVLLTNEKIIKKHVDNILSNVKNNAFIFNLGHGIMPSTPINNVKFLVEYVQK